MVRADAEFDCKNNSGLFSVNHISIINFIDQTIVMPFQRAWQVWARQVNENLQA